tara:strand:+ start:2865 stop:3665 length:801 start_codon:yes stop_codon:yes gene_type:complete
MVWGSLATQFCLELAFGVLLGLCLIPRAPLGVFFHRMMGTTALVPLLIAGLVPPLYAGVSWTSPIVVGSLAACAIFPFFSGPLPSRKRVGATYLALICCGVALVASVVASVETAAESGVSTGTLVLGSLSAMSTGVVAGGVGLAMVVGHWYLTVPQLPISLLVRLNRLTAWAMGASVVLLAATILVHKDVLQAAETPILSDFGLFYLGARVAVGLALPLLFAWMTSSSLKYENTRSATGILYASTVLVLIGAAAALSLQDSYGVPL